MRSPWRARPGGVPHHQPASSEVRMGECQSLRGGPGLQERHIPEWEQSGPLCSGAYPGWRHPDAEQGTLRGVSPSLMIYSG